MEIRLLPLILFTLLYTGDCSFELSLKAGYTFDRLKRKLFEVSCSLQQNEPGTECEYLLFCYIIKSKGQDNWNTAAQKCQSFDVDVKDSSVADAKGVISEDAEMSRSQLTLTWRNFSPAAYRKFQCFATFACTDSPEKPRVLSAVVSHDEDTDNYVDHEGFYEIHGSDTPETGSGLTPKQLSYFDKLMERFIISQTNITTAQINKIVELIKTNKEPIQDLKTRLTASVQEIKESLKGALRTQIQDFQRVNFTLSRLLSNYGQLEENFNMFSQQMRDSFARIGNTNATLLEIINIGKEVGDALKQLGEKIQLQENRIINLDTDVKNIGTHLRESFGALHGNITNISNKITENDKKYDKIIDIITDNKNSLLEINVFADSLTKSLKAIEEKETSMEQSMKVLQSVLKYNWKETSDITQYEWPNGSYSLLKSTYGCPVSKTQKWQWSEGYRKYHTELTSNNDHLSPNIHLQQPLKTLDDGKNFITLSFCVRNDGTPSVVWPKGSYCINRKGNCPNSFSSGYLYFDEEDDNFSGMVSGARTDNTTSGQLYFCCRGDASPDLPIVLPRVSPFYLYRLGGRCQRVQEMTYTEEYVYFDTENTNNSDLAVPPVPDGRTNGINITLCYYEADKSET